MADSLSIVYKKAAINKAGLDALLKKVAQRSSAKVVTNFKNPDTTVDKVERKNEENPKRNYKLSDVNDIARGRLVYNSLDALHKGVDTFKDILKRTPLTVAKQQDFFKHPDGGYRGYHIDLEFPNHQHVEVQLHTPQSYAATLVTHPMHEEFGDKIPQGTKNSKEEVSNQLMQLPAKEAEKLADTQEAKNFPATLQAQLKAQQVVRGQIPDRGNPNAAIVSPLGNPS